MTEDQELRELGEWDWWVLPAWNRLHAAVEFTYGSWPVGAGRTACGRAGLLAIPGIFTRMSAERCAHCCKKLGYPQGVGSPKNDKACRSLIEQRLAELDA